MILVLFSLWMILSFIRIVENVSVHDESVGGMERSYGEVIPETESDKGSKYLGILKPNDIMHNE